MPLLGFILFVQNFVFKEFDKNTIEAYTMQVRKNNDMTDQRFKTIMNITDVINSVIPTSITPRLQSVEASQELMKMLNVSTISNPYVNDILLYIEGDEYIYTSTSTYSLSNITSPSFYFTDLDDERFRAYLESDDVFILVPDDYSSALGYSDQILLARKVKLYDKNVTLFFTIDVSIFDSYQNDFILFDALGHPIYSNFDRSRNMSYRSLIDAGVIESKSAIIPMRYISFPPDMDFTVEKIHVLTKTFYYFLLFIIVVSVFGVYWGMTLNYTPVKEIENKDDINSVLMELIRGKGIGQFESNKRLYEMEKLDHGFMFVISFTVTNNRNILSQSLLENTLNLYLPGYLLCLQTNTMYCFIGSTDDAESYERMAREAWAALAEVNEEMDIAFSISNLFNGPHEIQENYEHVIGNLNNTFLYGNNCFLTDVEDTEDIDYEELYSEQYVQKLVYLLKSGAQEEVDEFVDDFGKKLKQSKYPSFYIKALCFNIVNRISQSLPDIPLPDFSSYFSDHDMATIDDLISGLRDIASVAVNTSAEKDMNDVIYFVGQLDAYLNEHVFEKDFSLQKMADDFNIPPSTLSSFYKKNTGRKMIDVVSEKRLDRASKLLLQGCSITEVISMVGYYNESSFIRKFKEYFGVTPRKYVTIMSTPGNESERELMLSRKGEDVK